MTKSLMYQSKLFHKPHIVFLDESTVDLGDVDLSEIKKLGFYKGYKDTPQNKILDRIKNADIALTNKVVFSKDILNQTKKLRYIGIAATGFNHIDIQAAQNKNIAVTNVANYSTESVAEHTLLFLLAISHRLLENQKAAAHSWSYSPSFAILKYTYSELKNKTLGIIGYGNIGKQVSLLAKSFGMKALIAKMPGRSYLKNLKRYSLKEVLQKSDFVSLHCPLNKNTYHLINQKKLSWMKSSSVLINMARGPLVDEVALAIALKRNTLSLYASDVLSTEPPPKHHPLLVSSLKNKVLLTPHVAWASKEARQKLINEMAKNIEAFLEGKKRNRIV